MHLGIALPFGDIGGDGPIVREYAELAEAEGCQDVEKLGGSCSDDVPAAERSPVDSKRLTSEG